MIRDGLDLVREVGGWWESKLLRRKKDHERRCFEENNLDYIARHPLPPKNDRTGSETLESIVGLLTQPT